MDFLGKDPVLVAHNLEYDHAILQANLTRYTGIILGDVVKKEIDTLKISKLIYPKLHSYKLKDLLTELNIAGKNSHNAKDDVEATANLIIRMIVDAAPIIERQKQLVTDNGKLLNRFRNKFKRLYYDSISKFEDNVQLETIVDHYFNHSGDGLDNQEKAEVEKLTRHMSRIDRNDNTTSLKERINKYIPDYKRYKESDLITGDEQVYLSTVYKAKGLEFDNVIVAEAVNGIYPYWASNTEEKKREDARTLYVALSRAKKRLYITCHSQSTNQYGKVFVKLPSPFIDSIRHHFDKK
jgi:DNA helicase-2/ATP-dependent DNA helicase PcrA